MAVQKMVGPPRPEPCRNSTVPVLGVVPRVLIYPDVSRFGWNPHFEHGGTVVPIAGFGDEACIGGFGTMPFLPGARANSAAAVTGLELGGLRLLLGIERCHSFLDGVYVSVVNPWLHESSAVRRGTPARIRCN